MREGGLVLGRRWLNLSVSVALAEHIIQIRDVLKQENAFQDSRIEEILNPFEITKPGIPGVPGK